MRFRKNNPIIEMKNVTKSYLVRHQKPTLVENLFSKNKKTDEHVALNNVTLNIYPGDRVGIIGKNGSGKTTLLKLISGITKQQSGKINVHAKVATLIDLEAGFHPELSGLENIFLNGMIIGMNREEIELKLQSITSFADIGKYIDAPVYTYSSGMKLRLGFSIAVHSDPDVLLLDESFAVGDESFRKKANARILSFKKKRKTLVMVSHWLKELERNCNSIIWLEDGKLIKQGGVELLEEYYYQNYSGTY